MILHEGTGRIHKGLKQYTWISPEQMVSDANYFLFAYLFPFPFLTVYEK